MAGNKLIVDIANDLMGNNTSAPYVKEEETSYYPTSPKWYAGDQPTHREIMGRIGSIYNNDRETGTAMLAQYRALQSDPSSKYYRYYSQPTNKAKKSLEELGFDTSYLTNGWIDSSEATTYIQSNLEHRSETGNSPSAPTKKSTWDNKVAFQLNQYKLAEDFTKQAEQEYADIINEVEFLAGNTLWNYSDDDIINRVLGVDDKGEIDYHTLKEKYPALYDMIDGAKKNNPKELNRVVDFSDDILYGAIWDARNPGQASNIEQAMAYSWMGNGNTWKENKEITNLISPMIDGEINDDYQPYAVGSTIAYEDALFFGRYGFDDAFIEENKHLKYDGTDEEKKHYANVETAVNNYHAAETAADAIYGYTNYLMNKGAKDAKEVQDALDVVLATGKLYVGTDKDGNKKYYTKAGKGREEINLDILNKMDASMGKNRGKENATEPDPNKIVPLGMGINYKYDNLIKQIETAYDTMNAVKDSVDTVASLDPDYEEDTNREKKPFELIAENKKRNASKSMGILEDRFSEFENRNFDASPTPNGSELADSFYEAKQSAMGASDKFGGPYDTAKLSDPEWVAKMATKQAEKADANYLQVSMDSLALRTNYETLQQETDELVEQLNQIEAQYNDVYLAREEIPENITLTGGPNNTLEFTFVRDSDGEYHYVPEEGDTESYYIENNYYNNGLTKADLEKEIAEKEQRLNDKYKSVQDARARIREKTQSAEEWLDGGTQIMTMEDEDGNSIDVPFVFDNATGQYVLSPAFNSESAEVDEYLENSGETREQLFNEIKNYKGMLNEEFAKSNYDFGAPSEDIVKSLRAQIDANTEKLEQGKEAYDKAVADVKRASDRRNRENDLALRNSGLYVDPTVNDSMINIVGSFTNYETPAAGFVNESGRYVSYLDGLASGYNQQISPTEYISSVNKDAKEMKEYAKDIRYILDNNQSIPSDYRQKMEEAASWYESMALVCETFTFSKDEYFAQYAKDGEGILLSDQAMSDDPNYERIGSKMGDPGWGQMTREEKDMYYALTARNGIDTANRFFDAISQSLIDRARVSIEQAAQETAESGVVGRIFNEALSIGSAAYEPALNLLYLIDSATHGGKGNEWLRIPSYAAATANKDAIAELKDIYKGTVWGEILPGFAEIVNFRGRSYLSGFLSQGMIPDISNSFLNNTVHAFPIATIAFGEAYEEAIKNHMEPWQALTIGLVNFASESMTEGIRFGNYKDLFDGNITLKSFKDYFIDKLVELDWLEEATGETLNNIVERSFNRWIGGDKSEHEKRIQEYIDSGLVESREEAEVMVMADYVKEDIHTAIVSALATFMDVGMFGLKKIGSTAYYANEARQYNKTHNDNVTIRDLRERDINLYNRMQTLQQEADKIRQEAIERARQPFVPVNPANVSEGQQAKNASEYDVDITILENSTDSDKATVTGTISAVLRVSDQNANRANAAAVAFATKYGNDAINALQDMLDAGQKSGTNINTLKLGIQYAMMAEGECNRVLNSEEYQNATPEQQAAMLSEATQIDANDPNVQNSVDSAVHENRIAEEEKNLFGENEAFELNALQENANEAAMKTYVAQQELDDKLQARKAASDNVTSITMDFLADPSDDNAKRKDQAEHELAAADAVVTEYKQHYQNAVDQQTKAENALETTKDEVMTRIRSEAEARVNQIEQQEAEALALQEQQRQEEIEREKQLQIAEDERTGKAREDADLAKIDAEIEKLNLKGERADQLREKMVQFYHDMKAGNVDTSRLLSDTESMLAINDMSRRVGVQIEIDKEGDPNALPEGKDGKYSNGKIVLSHRLTVGQAMLQVALHEITHSLEQTKSYAKYRDTVFDILFNSPEQREKAIQDKINFYKNNGVQNFTREDAEHEIVADFAMDDKTFANRATINRMLDEGLGGKIRNALHNINQYLKNVKLEGQEREMAENLRKAEALYIKAINERRAINTHPSSEQFSVNQFAQAAGLFYNEVDITDEKGNVLYKAGLYTADPSNPDNNAVRIDQVTPEMMENTPVGMLTNAALTLGTMDHETVGKIHKMFADLMTMCTNLQDTNLVWEIAGSTLYSEFSAIKGNSDKQYSTTVDFGTICTKTQAVINQLSRDMLRLGRGLTSAEILEVYNDVYNADLKVPCPVCYVFSRWLGVPSLLENIRQYQNRFLGEEGEDVSLEETQRRVDEFIENAHKKEYNIDEKFVEQQNKARNAALAKIERIKNGRDGIAKTEAKIANYKDKLATNPTRADWNRNLASSEKKLAELQKQLRQAEIDYENSDIAAYAKVINKAKADIEKKIKDKLVKIEGDDKGTRGINDDIRDAIAEGKPYDKLEAKKTALYAEVDSLREKLREVDAYNWVTQALCKLDENGRFVIDPEFKRTKNEVLLDLNRTGEFAKDTKNWTYRSTRGAGMGKAILPYSGATIGDSVLGTGARVMANPYEDGDVKGAFDALKSTIMKAYRQNLIGGQRFQSTSDFRPEWGLDYIMTFIEQQAIGSNGQLYTKVKEFVPMSASVGIDTNCSIMPYANGWHDPSSGEIEAMSEQERKSRVVTFKDENGNERTVILDFSDVTGMEYDAARDLSKSYDSVQMIMVGINDIHIRACLAGEEIDFVIPWHASGNTKSQLASMMNTVKEKLTNSSDYTKVQSDQIADKKALETAHGKQERGEDLTPYENDLIHKEQMREARQRLLTGATLTATDMERIAESEFLTGLYERFEGKTLPDENGNVKELPHDSAYWIEFPAELGIEPERVKMTSSQAEQIFPYEYWDTSLTKDEADENGWRFVQYCNELGLVPRFSGGNQKNESTGEVSRFGNFSGAVYDEEGNIIGYDRDKMAKGYWKTLIDRKMYDNNGKYRAQQKIDASKLQVGELSNGIHVNSNIPDTMSGANYRGAEADAKYEKADEAFKRRLEEKAKLGGKEGEHARIDLEHIQAWEDAHAEDREQYRVTPEINAYADLTTGEMMQLMRDAGVETESSDEQYSMNNQNSDEMTPAEMLQLFRDAGIAPNEQAPIDYQPTRPQRQFGSETIQNAEGVSQTVKNWLKTHSDYNPDTNEAQVDRAVKWVLSKRSQADPEGFWGALDEVESNNFNPLTADGQAKMYVLMSLASNKSDVSVQLRIADAINKQGTTLGQGLQARRLFRLMTPQGRQSVLKKEVDRVNAELKRNGKPGNVTLSDWIYMGAAAAQTEEEFAKVREKMWQELGSQLPVSWWDRFQAWRMVSMLGNPRTHIRNLAGNLFFVPAVQTKNKIGAALESIFIPEGQRTKAFLADKEALEYADMDSERVRSELKGEAKYSDANQIQRRKKPFGNSKAGQVVQAVSDYSSEKLEQEDWLFLHYHYKHALAGWMTANNVTGKMLENDSSMRDTARAYAIEEAKKATYRDANALAEWLSKGDRIPGVRFLTTSILPFKKTPMNILERGLEYSPLGFLKNITVDAVRLAEYQKWATGKKSEKASWALSPTEYIDKISSGLTGIGIAGLGAFMKSMGWLTLGFKKDDPEDKFKKAKGQQEYSLNINLFGQDISYTIDWAAPVCMPLFVGATIQEAYESQGFDLGATLEGLGSFTEPIWNLSMLDGTTSLFETSQYEDMNVGEQILLKVGLNWVNSLIPTAVGQLSRAIDPARRKTYVTSGSKPSTAYYSFEQMQNKTPFSVYNIPYRDYRGREDRRPELVRLAENMLSPGYSSFPQQDSTLDELERLYMDNKGDENVKKEDLNALVPTDADKSFSIKGQTIRLTDQQYDQMDVERKQIAFGLLDQLMADPYYAQVDDIARIDMISDIWTYATQQAKYNQFPQFSREDWITRAQKNNIDMLDVVKKRSEEQIKSDSITGWGDALVESIKTCNQDDIDMAVQTLELLDQDNDDIEKIVKNGFRGEYVKAYKDGDEDTMEAIEDILYQAGFDFDYEDWLKTTIKNEDKWLEDYNQ